MFGKFYFRWVHLPLETLVCGSEAIYQLKGDGNDRLCLLRGYFLYSSTGPLYHT
jgi:hypothetical protein